ncbi:hypothetical protein GCM10010260_53600 [Streptomyces filipinensis]|uniref:Uncharacterized protein n=1 Tax=Streptomyces filipinensis TaxID=66887 RepID=A0A918IFT6_9ACTN|nr:hypothetical protein [Streptomyces filipinensis]GGV08745.1 hypothetical protein GCM10010260_53600 [Streptomyces filipinensis]
MSYPPPPGSGHPYGQPPPQSGWQPQPQWQSPAPVPPPMPTAPPAVPAAPLAHPAPSPYGAYSPPQAPAPAPYGAYPPAPTAVPAPPAPPSGAGGGARKVLGVLLGVSGLLGLLGGGALAAHAYSNSRQSVPNSGAYGPVLWRDETVDHLFPATIGQPPDSTYQASDKKAAQWNRMGVSEDTSCAAGLSGETGKTARRLGCKAVLRATYVDLSGETVATVAVIVLPKGGTAAQQMGEYLDGQQSEDIPDAAVVPLRVPGTLAAKWQESRRNGMGGTGLGDDFPYAVAVTTGAVDGRASSTLPRNFEGNDADRQPWMDAAKALSETFHTHILNLAR